MRRLILPVALLLSIVAVCTLVTWRVEAVCQEASGLLEQAEARAAQGDFDRAEALIRESEAVWSAHEGFLGTTLRHTESDDISVMYPVLREACRHGDGEDFAQRSQELRGALRALWRMEIPYYYNVL